MPAFAGMTVFLADSVAQNHTVTPAKAGVPFLFLCWSIEPALNYIPL